ncbi:MAG: hypothetical protein QG637_983, partial [Chloroflexota bacterium]|nr:hypothetical protein [Chloroflexota bacterium]
MSTKPAFQSIPRLAVSLGVGSGLLAALLIILNAITLPGLAGPLERPGQAERTGAVAAPAGKSTIGDYVWYDAAGDGEHFDAEGEYDAGIDGALINLYEDFNKNGVLDTSELNTLTTTTTGDDPNTIGIEHGWYNFNVTAEGRRYFIEVAPSNFAPGGPLQGFALTSDATYPIIFTNTIYVALPGVLQDNLDVDFGFRAYADVGVLKNGAPDPGVLGTTVTYTIRIFNNGAAVATGVIATDTLPAGLDNIAVAASQGSGCTNAAVFTCSLGTLNVGDSAFVTVTGRAIITGSLPNTVTVSAAQVDLDLTNNSASATITVGRPAITIAKTPDLQQARAGDTVTFTIRVTNTGD